MKKSLISITLLFLAPLLFANSKPNILPLEDAVEIAAAYLEENELKGSYVMSEVLLSQNHDATEYYWTIRLKETGTLASKGGNYGRLIVNMEGNAHVRRVRIVLPE